jgi:exosortase A-associated hydrolase 2
MTTAGLAAHFLTGGRGRILAVLRTPRASSAPSVLLIAPFAEEMNKTRRLLADAALALAMQGLATVLPDLYGTGDSDGEFRDADWAGWHNDLVRTAAWAAEQGWPVRALLCVRLGCILGAQLAAASLAGLERTAFWQPVIEGERHLLQFLRLRVAAGMMDTPRAETVPQLQERLRGGEALEISGYELGSRLAGELATLRLAEHLSPRLGAVRWWEVVRSVREGLPEASERLISQARTSGLSIAGEQVTGEPFWAATEIVRNAELVERTAKFLAPVRVA